MDKEIYLDKLDSGISATKDGAKELLKILLLPLDSTDDKMKVSVESKRTTAVEYFAMLDQIKIQTLIYASYFSRRSDEKIHIEDLKHYLEEAYEDGLNDLEECLNILKDAICRDIDFDELGVDKMKSIAQSKRIASDDYFFLLKFIEEKGIEKGKIRYIGDKVVSEVESENEVEIEKSRGFAEEYAQ